MIKLFITFLVFASCVGKAAFAAEADGSSGADKAAKIVVVKSAYKMYLLNEKSEMLKMYNISLGGSPKGKKTQEGDQKTPEGNYFISGRNPGSKYHRSLRVSYPNEEDMAQAKERGVSAGGDIMIHGVPNGWGWLGFAYKLFNWTGGCIAVKDSEIEEIWNLVPDGIPIEIYP